MTLSLNEFFNAESYVKGYSKYKNLQDINLKILKRINHKSVLSLGCGSGREARELVKNNNKVIGIDIAKKLIASSKIIEPHARYFCCDAVDFARKNKDKLKFDYILGLYSLFNYIKKEDRKELIENLFSMLNTGGKIILEVRWWNDRWQDILKCCYYYFFNKEFGDISQTILAHHYTRNQIKELLEEFDFSINGSVICIIKNRSEPCRILKEELKRCKKCGKLL